MFECVCLACLYLGVFDWLKGGVTIAQSCCEGGIIIDSNDFNGFQNFNFKFLFSGISINLDWHCEIHFSSNNIDCVIPYLI